jgi:alanine dehydrogenase
MPPDAQQPRIDLVPGAKITVYERSARVCMNNPTGAGRTAPVVDDSATLLLSREAIARSVPPGAYLAAVGSAFRRLGAGELHTPSVSHLAGLDGAFHIKAAISLTFPRRAAVKINGNFPQNVARCGLPVIQGFIALLDGECGRILALMDSIEITARRTAATSALAAQQLARAESRRLAFIGCGVQARYHFEAFAELYRFDSVALYDRSAEHATELAHRVQDAGLPADVRTSARAAALSADIIVTSTPSRAALLGLEDVCAGAYIAAVGADSGGKQELAPALLRRARVVPDVLAQAAHMGDLQHALAAGVMTPQDIHGELADVVCGRAPGRSSDDELFVFDSTGSAVADFAAAEMAYEIACRDPAALRIHLN